MLNKVSVVADGKYPDINTSLLKNYVRQKGNSRWFSAVKIPLGVYAMAGTDSTKWINRTLKSMGEAPVVYDTLQVQDYSKYEMASFDGDHKHAMRETQFPLDLEYAFRIGAE